MISLKTFAAFSARAASSVCLVVLVRVWADNNGEYQLRATATAAPMIRNLFDPMICASFLVWKRRDRSAPDSRSGWSVRVMPEDSCA
jgi:hypothetical protein